MIHKYSKGWQDGKIYDEIFDGAIEAINEFLSNGYNIFIFSARPSKQIVKWFNEKHKTARDCFVGDAHDWVYTSNFKLRKIPFWTKFWKNQREGSVPVVGVTNRKLPADIYIDDRAIVFTNWKDVMEKINIGEPTGD